MVGSYDMEGCSIAVEMCETAFKGDRSHMKRLLNNKVPLPPHLLPVTSRCCLTPRIAWLPRAATSSCAALCVAGCAACQTLACVACGTCGALVVTAVHPRPRATLVPR